MTFTNWLMPIYIINTSRDENGRKRSAKGSTFTFIFFHRKQKRCNIIGKENGIDNEVISETKIYGRGHTEKDRNPSKQYLKNDKYVKP